MAELKDRFANMLVNVVTESGANTLTFEEIVVGLNIFDKVGLIIHLIEYMGMETQLAAASDRVEFGLSSSNGWAAPVPTERSIITYDRWFQNDYGVPANAVHFRSPHIRDFSNFPGGGILTAPKPLFLYAMGTACAAANVITARIYFTVMKMQPGDYIELLETRNFFG